MSTNEERLRALGFDKGARGCSQCQALSVNGTPTHEAGCPNARAARRRAEDEDEGQDREGYTDEDEDEDEDTGRYVSGYRVYRNGTEREDFGGDR